MSDQKIESNGVVFAGPFLGEFGWELSHWMPHVRWLRQQYKDRKIIVASYKGRHSLYQNGIADEFWSLPDWFTKEKYDCDCFESLCGQKMYAKIIKYFKDKLESKYISQNIAWTKPPRGFNKILRNNKHVLFDKLTASANAVTESKRLIQQHGGKPVVIVFAREVHRKTFLDVVNNQIRHCEDLRNPLPSNNWPRSYWENLFERLYDQFGDKVTFAIGGTKDGNCLLGIAKEYGDVIDLADIDISQSLDITIAMLNSALCSISSQSGPTHLSVQCGCPSFIYGHEEQRHMVDDNPLEADVVFMKTGLGMYNDQPETLYKEAMVYINQLLGEMYGKRFDGGGLIHNVGSMPILQNNEKIISSRSHDFSANGFGHDPACLCDECLKFKGLDKPIEIKMDANKYINAKGETFEYSPDSYSKKSEDWIKNITSEQTLLDKYADPWPQGYIDRWKNWFDGIEINGRVLDIGFQNGKTLYQLSQKYPDVKIDALDFNHGLSNAIPFYKKLMPNLEDIWIGDCQNINKPDGYYDNIHCIDFYEHLPEEVYQQSMKECYRLLKNNGEMFVYVGKTDAHAHIHLVPNETVIKDMTKNGFNFVANVSDMLIFKKPILKKRGEYAISEERRFCKLPNGGIIPTCASPTTAELKKMNISNGIIPIKRIGMVGVFDVAGGTNIPFAKAFDSAGYHVDGFNYRTVASKIGWEKTNQEIVKSSANYDLIIFCKCNGVTAKTITACGRNAKTCWYMMDAATHLKTDKEYYKMAGAADFSVVTAKAVYNELTEGECRLPDIYHILQGIDPKEFHPFENVEKKYDVVFIGQKTTKREVALAAIEDAGYSVKEYGQGYEASVCGEAFNQACAEGRILLAINNTDSNEDSFSDRIMRYMANKGCVLTEYSKGLENYFTRNKEVLWFEAEYEMIENIDILIKDSELREEIAASGYRKVLENHTWDKVAEKIIKIATGKEERR